MALWRNGKRSKLKPCSFILEGSIPSNATVYNMRHLPVIPISNDNTFPDRTLIQWLWYLYGWVFIRPKRWFFQRLLSGSGKLRILPNKLYGKWRSPNILEWIGYRIIFRPLRWCFWNAIREFSV